MKGLNLFVENDNNLTRTFGILPLIPINKILKPPNFFIFLQENTEVKSWIIQHLKPKNARKSIKENR